MRLCVVVPCRDEARVVARKAANLARAAWPASERPHALVFVDDGSRDGTRTAAESALRAEFAGRTDVVARAIVNRDRPGKPGAVLAGLAEARLAAAVLSEARPGDLIVLTDADVVIEERALVELAAAFERDPRLALACGAQRFVAALAADGACRAPDGAEPRDAAGTYDRWTAAVRRLESRAGILFSVHGQLCAWRASLGIAPTPGVAADDVDLRFQVKARATEPRRVELVPSARFLEVKAAPGPERDAQAARRARAWFQALRGRAIPARGALERVQALLYRCAPRAAPAASALALPALAALLFLLDQRVGAALVLALGAGVLLSPLGRRWIDLALLIERAARAAPATDRWETPRP
jgi:hypothetical protein